MGWGQPPLRYPSQQTMPPPLLLGLPSSGSRVCGISLCMGRASSQRRVKQPHPGGLSQGPSSPNSLGHLLVPPGLTRVSAWYLLSTTVTPAAHIPGPDQLCPGPGTWPHPFPEAGGSPRACSPTPHPLEPAHKPRTQFSLFSSTSLWLGKWMLMATVSIQALSVFLGSSTYPLYTWGQCKGDQAHPRDPQALLYKVKEREVAGLPEALCGTSHRQLLCSWVRQ